MNSFKKPTAFTSQFQLRGIIVLACIAITLLGGCNHSPGPVRSASTPVESKAELANSLAVEGKYDIAAELYWELALASPSPAKERYQLRAAELSWQGNDLARSKSYLSTINQQALSADQRVRFRILHARLSIASQQFRTVLELLPVNLITQAPSYSQIILQLRARALAGNRQPLEAIKTYTQLLNLQKKPTARRFTEQALWQQLSSASAEQLDEWLQQSTDAQIKGWITLNQTKRARYLSTAQLSTALSHWRQQHPQHPASEDLMVSIVEDWESYFIVPEKVAVLLPMSGRYARLAETIYNGILTSRELATEGAYAPEVLLYDTGNESIPMQQFYQQAIQDGAEFIIGPLRKEAVNELASMRKLPIPVLTLNYADANVPAPVNLFQFGLLPEDEAAQVAERATMQQHLSAAILTPNNEWGTRLVDAFTQRYQALGGHVAQVTHYDPANTDFSAPIKSLLNLDESENRFNQLRNTLNRSIEFQPQRRTDIDFIFMISTPGTARLLKPQLSFYYAGDLPVYSTSHIYSGIVNTSMDQDINGVVFCDIPWILEPTIGNELAEELLELRGSQNYKLLPRFAALGIDALQIVPHLKQLAAIPEERFHGVTGSVSIRPGNLLFRELNWAYFKDGKPVPVQYQLSNIH